MGPALDKTVSPIRPSASRLVPVSGRKAMLTSKICREHASKCNRVAETIPRGAQREMFLDLARRWIDLAINIESTEALINPTSPANDPREPYRLIVKAPAQLRPQEVSAPLDAVVAC